MRTYYSRSAKRTARSFVFISIVVLLLYSLRGLIAWDRRYDIWPWATCPGMSLFNTLCTSPQALVARDTQIVTKTGGSEPTIRLRSHFETVLNEVPKSDLLVFSDIEGVIDDNHIYDAFAGMTVQERANCPEFALHDAQQELKNRGEDTQSMKGGWELSKYMNLAMLRKIWSKVNEDQLAQKQWYVFIETDTFVEWDNLFKLLGHLDPAKPIYIGSPVWLPGLQFAHGGSAYVLSYGAVEALNKPDSRETEGPFYSQYDLNTTEFCCGDEALARVLKRKGVKLRGHWPMFNGEIPSTISFGKEIWCEPVISLHHLGAEGMHDLWKWTREWKATSTGALLFKDLFRFVFPQISDALQDWDNTQEDMKIYPSSQAPHKSFQTCRLACEADWLCFQFVYDGDSCALSHRIRLGSKRDPEELGTKRYMSGWVSDRIRLWTQDTTCASAHWVRSNP